VSCDDANFFYRADDPVNEPYVTLWAGMVATQDTDIDAGNVHADVSFDNGFAGGLAVGYDFGPARLEVEGGYRNSNIENSDEDLTIKSLMLNAYADFKTGGVATPYLGAGIGYAQVEVDDEDDDVVAGQLGAGVLFALSPSVAVDLGYRFMMTDDPDIGGAQFKVRQHTALLGVQVRF
jgi:opacity protein-like surface antigen